MKQKLLTAAASALLLTCISSYAGAHTLTTATGHTVSHGHYGTCGPNGCPISDSSFESQVGFSSSSRVYSGTGAWNCHGRTFDARQSWTYYADTWLNYDGPVCPVSPGSGDTIIWWGSDGWTSHSVTIVSSWNNLSTTVMSKYGTQGQYRHALSNTTRVYGSNWAVTRFTAGTRIYSGLQAGSPAAQQPFQQPDTSTRDRLLQDREEMPWYEAVLESQLLYEIEHPRLVAKIAGLRQDTLDRLAEAQTGEERIDLLLQDLQNPEHYGFLNVYISPAHSQDFIQGIEAGKLLVSMAQSQPDLRPVIISRLRKAFGNAKLELQDRFRGATVHFLSQILTPEERTETKARLRTQLPKAEAPGEQRPPTYTEYYLDKM